MMEVIKVFAVGTLGGVFLQSMEPLPGLMSGITPGELLLRTAVSILGGVVSTLMYRWVQSLPWPRRRQATRLTSTKTTLPTTSKR